MTAISKGIDLDSNRLFEGHKNCGARNLRLYFVEQNNGGYILWSKVIFSTYEMDPRPDPIRRSPPGSPDLTLYGDPHRTTTTHRATTTRGPPKEWVDVSKYRTGPPRNLPCFQITLSPNQLWSKNRVGHCACPCATPTGPRRPEKGSRVGSCNTFRHHSKISIPLLGGDPS